MRLFSITNQCHVMSSLVIIWLLSLYLLPLYENGETILIPGHMILSQ